MQQAIRGLESYPNHVSEYTDLIPTEAAQAVIEAIEARMGPCVPRASHGFAAQLVAFYPSREVNDATTYLAGVTALFSAYPEDFVKRACDPVTGLPSKCKWFPTLAEIKEALEVEKVKRDKILFNAKWTVMEAARRERQRAEEATYMPGTPEERAAAVRRILQRNPINSVEAA